MYYAIDKFRREGIDVIFQLGDLGVWPGKSAADMWTKANARLLANEQVMYVVPGNHEDYDRIARLTPDDEGWLPFRSRIRLAPRGHRATFGTLDSVWLGGAGSIDRYDRLRIESQSVPGATKLWWAQEAITDTDVERTAAGGHATLMVTHEAPLGVPGVSYGVPDDVGMLALAAHEYAEKVRATFTRAVDGVQPRLLLHGHHHRLVDEVLHRPGYETHVFGLACDEMNRSLGELDTETLEVTAWDIAEDMKRHRRLFH